MCSIGEDDFDDEGAAHSMLPEPAEPVNINGPSEICSKCNKDEVAVKLSFKVAECQSCFLNYVRHKFRASLGSSKILPKDANVLIVFDGGPNSVALLDMANYAQTQNTFKRLHCNLKVLFVNDSFLGHQPDDYVEKILNILRRYSLDSYYVSLASKESPVQIVTDHEVSDLLSLSRNSEAELKKVLGETKSLTSKQDLLLNLRKNAIRSAAKQLQTPFVFESDISPDLATVFLTNISLGRGGSTAHDIALVDNRIENLKLIRPLKDLTEVEVSYYNKFNNLPTADRHVYGSDALAMASIQNVTKLFVHDLQEKFSSTVSTVFRTGNKIAAKDQQGKICKLCRSPIGLAESKTLLAIEFSRIVSQYASSDLNDTSQLEEKARTRIEDDNSKGFCHACRTILRDGTNDGIEALLEECDS